MRLSCDIAISSRLGSSAQCRSHGKPVHASLAIGRKPGDKNTDKGCSAYLMVCTAKERNGTKYKIHGNILQVFNKFTQSGKATIRFQEPSHDLFISKADPTSLKSFISLLKLSSKNIERAALSTLLPAKLSDLEMPKKELIIKGRADYPLSKPFPDKLQRLTVTNCEMRCFDRRILNLKELTYLSLSGNTIKELPLGLAKMNLTELCLVKNGIKEFHWALCTRTIAATLRLLDLRDNHLQFMPSIFCNLQSLIHVKLDNNELHTLPLNIGSMRKLRFLSASGNNLRVLPISLKKLRLDTLDISNNPFMDDEDRHVVCNLHLPSLLELAGVAARKHSLPYTPQSVPSSLCLYLDSAKECLCGKRCFSSCIHHIVKINIHQIAHTVVSTGPTQSLLPAEGYLCSRKCLLVLQTSRARHVYL